MTEYVTFIGKDPDGNVLDRIIVTLYAGDGSIAVQDHFGPGTPETGINRVLLPEGIYEAWVRSDGYSFAYRESVAIGVGDGPDINHPLVVEFEGASTSTTSEAKCLVWGRIERPSPNSMVGVERQAHGSTFDDGPSRHTTMVAHTVVFDRIGASAPGEQRSLVEKGRTRVSVDRNGYFEAELPPNSLFSVSVPNVPGSRKIVTPDPGVSAELDSLVDASLTTPLYDLV